jgi:hypothetical protein
MPNSNDYNKIKRLFEPREEFMEETRILFLTRIEEINGKTHSAVFIFAPFWKYSFAAIFIIIFLSGGLVIYADSNNVSVNNPLYGLKKTGEKVRLMVAPKERRPIVCHQIAQRRIEEMHGLKDTNDHRMESLNNEYKKDMDLSLDGMAGLNKEKTEQFKELCDEMQKTMSNKVAVVKAADIDDSISGHLKEHCAEFIISP